MEVTNESSTPMHVNVYAAAATIAKGEFTFAPERTSNELTGWTSLDTADLDLAASKRREYAPPSGCPGTPPPGNDTASSGRRRAHPRTARTMWRCWAGWASACTSTSVPVVSHPRTSRSSGSIQPEPATGGGGSRPDPQHGGRALDISGALSLFDGPGGLRAGPFSAKTGTTLAPGGLAEAVVPLDARLPDGPWTVKLTLKSGLVERATRATITFPTTLGSVGAVAASVAQQGHFPTPVVAGLSALVLTALCLLLSKFLRRRR